MSPGPGRPRDLFARRSLESIFVELKDRVRKRAPELSARGPEDPAWVLLEVFAEALSELEEEAQLIEERVFPRVLESLGDEPRWAEAATTPIVFVPTEGAEDPVSVPRGTTVSAPRRDGEAPIGFETSHEAWVSTARLVRAVTCAGEEHSEIFAYPQSGWDSEPVTLFGGRETIVRHLYLGDAALFHLRDRPGALVVEWPGNPQVVWEGRWEYSVHGGWRAAHVEVDLGSFVEGRAGQKRAVTLRIAGPLPDLSEERIESSSLPWLRLSLEGERRTTLAPPRWVIAEPASAASALAFPRPISRVLSHGGERWEDHSLTAQKIVPVESPEAWDPAVYLGWDRPAPASVYWSLQGRTVPFGWTGVGGKRAPTIAWEHSSGRGFRAFDVADGTRGFARSGSVTWDLPHEWTPQEHFGEKLHWVRARWVSGAYFAPPRVRALLPHAVEAHQRRTILGHILEAKLDRCGRGAIVFSLAEGEPDRIQAIEAREESGAWRRLVARSAPEPAAPETDAADPQNGAPAEASTSASDVGRFSVVRLPRGGYILDVGPPWTGAVTLKLPLLRATLGARGNVPAGTLTVLEAQIPGVRRALQPLAADGGMDPESSEAFRRRVRAEWRTGDRAVTDDDFRRLAMALDPAIARVETVADPARAGRVTVSIAAVEPCAPGRFSPARLEWIAEQLEQKAPLGTVVEVVEPMYVLVEVVARVRGEGLPPLEELRRQAEERLRRHAHPLTGGSDGRGFPAGRWLQTDEISSIMSPVLRGGEARPRRGELSVLSIEIRAPGGRALPACVESSSASPTCPLVIPVIERLLFELQERSSA